MVLCTGRTNVEEEEIETSDPEDNLIAESLICLEIETSIQESTETESRTKAEVILMIMKEVTAIRKETTSEICGTLILQEIEATTILQGVEITSTEGKIGETLFLETCLPGREAASSEVADPETWTTTEDSKISPDTEEVGTTRTTSKEDHTTTEEGKCKFGS